MLLSKILCSFCFFFRLTMYFERCRITNAVWWVKRLVQVAIKLSERKRDRERTRDVRCMLSRRQRQLIYAYFRMCEWILMSQPRSNIKCLSNRLENGCFLVFPLFGRRNITSFTKQYLNSFILIQIEWKILIVL